MSARCGADGCSDAGHGWPGGHPAHQRQVAGGQGRRADDVRLLSSRRPGCWRRRFPGQGMSGRRTVGSDPRPNTVYLAGRAPMPGGVGAASAVLSKPY